MILYTQHTSILGSSGKLEVSIFFFPLAVKLTTRKCGGGGFTLATAST